MKTITLVSPSAIPGYDMNMMSMLQYQFCYAEIIRQDIKDTDQRLIMLATLCKRNGLEQEFCVKRLMHNHLYCNLELLVRRCFQNVFDNNHIQYPYMSVPRYTIQTELLKDFFSRRYVLRRNAITGQVEYLERGNMVLSWQPLTKQRQNGITIEALCEGIEAWDKDVNRYLNSSLIDEYNPIEEYFDMLPEWDGVNHIEKFAQRVKTNYQFWEKDFHQWFIAMVAQWKHCDSIHGNAMVPLLIGKQGNGKSTFCRMILPPELRPYYTDRIDFKNKNEAERHITSFALINLDEYDSLSPRQNTFLKHILQKTDVKSRNPYESIFSGKARYASFIGTTNCPTPLTDVTGSRRFMCVKTIGIIDTKSGVNYPQMYSQALHEIAQKRRIYFTKSSETRIQKNNSLYFLHDPMEEVFLTLFKKPEDGDITSRMTSAEILKVMKKYSSFISASAVSLQRLSKFMTRNGFKYVHSNRGNFFYVTIKPECDSVTAK